MLISHILNSKGSTVVTVAPDDLVVTLLNVLAEHHIGAVVVSHDGTHVDGIVSERDVVRAMAADPDAGTSGGVRPKPISAIMTVDVAVATPDTHVDDVMALMRAGDKYQIVCPVSEIIAIAIAIAEFVVILL